MDRQVQSQTQTPQPPITTRNATPSSVNPAATASLPPPTQQSARSSPIGQISVGYATIIPTPSQHQETAAHITSNIVTTVNALQSVHHGDPIPRAITRTDKEAVTIGVPQTRNVPQPGASPQISKSAVENLEHQRPQRGVILVDPLQRPRTVSQQPIQENPAQEDRHTAKRLKLGISHPSQPEAQRSPIVPTAEDRTPTTDADHGASALQNNPMVAASPQGAKLKEKSRTTTAKGKQRMENMATSVVVDTVDKERQPRKARRKTTGSRVPRKGRMRAITPDNAEGVEIVPTVVKMSDLCRDLHTGKKSLRAEEIRIFEQEEAAKRQAAKQRGTDTQEAPSSETINQLINRVGGGEVEQSGATQPHPEFQLVNGEIVIVESSLRLDRHANAEAAREAEPVVVIEESALTHRSNSHSFMKKEKRHNWNEEMTDLFYDGLRMFGTDFNMISKMFPGRSRASIKLKFTKEEKLDREKIKQTLLGERISVNLEEFSKMSNTTYIHPSELERDMEEDRRRLEEEQTREKEAMDEVVRQRAADAAAESAAACTDSSAKKTEIQRTETDHVGKSSSKRSKTRNTKGQKKGMLGKA